MVAWAECVMCWSIFFKFPRSLPPIKTSNRHDVLYTFENIYILCCRENMILAHLDNPKVFLHFPVQSVAAFKFWNTNCNTFQWARCPFSAQSFSHCFVFCLLFLALATIYKKWSICSGCESFVCPKICFFFLKKNNHNTKETKQNIKLKKRKENMKKRRSNAIIRNKLFDAYGIKPVETWVCVCV